jgi:formylmethanofuran dehydrogenase subunit E
MNREELKWFVQVLCAGCLEWFRSSELKCTGGHPYCIDCFPRAVKGKAMELPGRGGAR